MSVMNLAYTFLLVSPLPKTLRFLQALRSRLTCAVRALAVLPVTDLATQVYNVFQTYCKDSCLKVSEYTDITRLVTV